MIKRFEKYIKLEKRFSPHTINSYITDIKQFYEFVGADTEQIIQDSNLIRSWTAHLVENSTSPISVKRKISSLKSFYKYLKKNNKISVNPMTKIVLPKVEKKIPEFIPEKDFDHFDTIFTNDFSGIRDRLIIELLYQTGIRRAELLSLKDKDIDTAKKQIKVLGKRQKERIIPITDYLAELIMQYQTEKRKISQIETIFLVTDKGKPIYASFVYRKVKKYLTQITTLDKKSPHTMRHTFATHLLNNGADLNAIKELLGHSNLSATQIYTHNSFEKITTIYKQAHPRA